MNSIALIKGGRSGFGLPLELDVNAPASVESALAEWSSEGGRSIS